jgi:hypothetical protein
MCGEKMFNSPKVPFLVHVPTCDMKSAWIPENLIRVWSITNLAQYQFPDKLDNMCLPQLYKRTNQLGALKKEAW